MVKSRPAIRPADLLRRFAGMAERSRSEDGDRQGDGWGICLRNENGGWCGYWSLRPVWEEEGMFATFPAARRFVIHARSASFPGHRGKLEFNQPYVADGRAFVFNGLLKGVSAGRPLRGEIGAQKIWSLFGTLNPAGSSRDRMEALMQKLETSAREISALNLGLASAEGLFAYCRATASGAYYRLQAAETPDLRMVCSEQLSGFDFRPLQTDAIVRL
jgi:predicted glutamine amidotransferase